MREFLRTVVATAFALLIVGAGVQDSLLLCRSQKTVHRTCCCKKKTELQEIGRGGTSRVDEVRRAPCCDSVDSEVIAVPPSTSSAVAFALPPPVLLEAMMPVRLGREPLLENEAVAIASGAPRVPTGPPIPIRHRALLI